MNDQAPDPTGTPARSPIWAAVVSRLRRRRVPVLLQMSSVECGAACLAMILNYYGRKTRVAECREACGIGRDGATARTIAEAARNFGLRVKGYSLEGLSDFRHVQLPAIIHWEFNHFMVIERWSPKRVDVVDPALGRRALTAQEFAAGFTGVVLTFEPGIQFDGRAAAYTPSWRGYFQSMLKIPNVPRVLAQVLGASLLLQLVGLALPTFTEVLVNQILPFRLESIMTALALGLLVLVLAQMVITYLRAALLIYLQGRLDSQMMLGFLEHVLALPFRFFQQRTSGDLLMRLSSNMMIREALTNQTISAILDGSFVIAYLAILLARNVIFGLVVLGVGMLQVAILLSTTKQVRDLTQQDLSTQAESQSYLVEALMGIATVKASGTEDRVLDHWSNLFFKHLNVSLKRSHFSAVVETALGTLRTLAPLLLLWLGALLVLHDRMGLGKLLFLNALGAAFLAPLASLVSSGHQLQTVRAHLDRIADVVEAEPEQSPEATQSAVITGRIELKQVSFRYDPNAPWVLREISLVIPPGRKVALIGRTGAGKSTLAMLLLGLYVPTSGEILYDDIPLQRLNYRALRRQFGAVLQESFLFNGSIRQNIAFHNPNLSLEEVMDAARQAVIHDEIVEMPMQYDTLVAEGGGGLSGGQRQRLSLARALAHKPAILLLDEATSHLDSITEAQVDKNLSRRSGTRIVIAHRLSTICNADLILVLANGAIAEQGNHEQLLAQGGYYAELVRTELH
jgi:ABC-type bacteriocin/lantibiotic exporter with double-glycine peptidase domain